MELVNARIVSLRPMTPAEMEAEGWSIRHGKAPTALVLDNGAVLYASQDHEGNGPGAIFGREKTGAQFGLL